MENSKIEWTDHTFNPGLGCAKVSDGGRDCYAEELMDKRYGKVQWGAQGTRLRTSAANWKLPFEWNRLAKEQGDRARVFCASLADVFEDKLDQWQDLRAWRKDLFQLIELTPHLDWLLLTKRPGAVNRIVIDLNQVQLPANVWLGTSVENQEQADKRIPELLKIPASVRFLSVEPLLGPVDLGMVGPIEYENHSPSYRNVLLTPLLGPGVKSRIDWVIVGGESGRNARPMHISWLRSIQKQCELAGVPFLFKQWGEWLHRSQWQYAGYTKFLAAEPGTEFLKVGKKAAGRLLDGIEHNGFPQAVPQ